MDNIDVILKEYREQIDWIDKELVYLLSRRFEIVKTVWELKKIYKVVPLQPNRWQEVLNKLEENWKNFWVSQDFLKEVWELIHQEALKIEKK